MSSEQELLKTRQFLLLAVLIIVFAGALIFRIRYRIKMKDIESKQNLSNIREALANAEAKNERLSKEKLEEELKVKTQELIGYTNRMSDQNKLIDDFQERIKELEKYEEQQQKHVADLSAFVDRSSVSNLGWEEFRLKFDSVYPSFGKSITERFEYLTSRDIDICMLLKINLTNLEISETLGSSYQAVKKSTLRLAQKMNFTSTEELRKFLLTVS